MFLEEGFYPSLWKCLKDLCFFFILNCNSTVRKVIFDTFIDP